MSYVVLYCHNHGIDTWCRGTYEEALTSVGNTMLDWLSDIEEEKSMYILEHLSTEKFGAALERWTELTGEHFEVIDVGWPHQHESRDEFKKRVAETLVKKSVPKVRATNVDVIFLPVGKPAELRAMKNDLASMQALVGGDIESICLGIDYPKGAGRLDVWCNENGKSLKLKPNMRLRWRADGVRGDAFVVRSNGEGELVSITENDLRLFMEAGEPLRAPNQLLGWPEDSWEE